MSDSNQTSALANEKAAQARKNKMWEMRMVFIQRGHRALQNKMYGEAAVNYEKYIRTLEVVFGAPAGGLNPEYFKESARTAEMSVLAGVAWDLVRIYDTNKHHAARQDKAVSLLSQFAPLTPLHNEFVKRAQNFMRVARHPERVKVFLTNSGKSSRCFIATAAFASPADEHVLFLRNYRDEVLKKTNWGRKFIYFYYRYSPKVACILDRHMFLRAPTRWALKLVIKCVSCKKNPL